MIADDIWAKLLWAGLTVTEEDLLVLCYHRGFQGTLLSEQRDSWYPVEMFRAMVIVWLFTGLAKTNLVVCELDVFDGSVKMWLCHGQERRFPKMQYVS